MRGINWLLKKLIARERARQIFKYGYTPEHDDRELKKDPYHLLDEAQNHYRWGHLIQALALLEAQHQADERSANRLKTRLSEDK